MSRPRVSDAIDQAIFFPTAIAYICLVVGYLRTGLALYLVFVIGGCFVGWFKHIAEWPLIPRIMLACGPLLLGLGYYFSTQEYRSGMLAPGVIYYGVSAVSTFALKRLD